MRRRRSKSEGKKVPRRNLGIASSMSPAAVVTSLGRCPLQQGGSGLAVFVWTGPDGRRQLGLDQLLEHPGERGADPLGQLARLDGGEQLGQVRLGEGHRRGLLRDPGKEHAEHPAGGPPLRWILGLTYTTSGDGNTDPGAIQRGATTTPLTKQPRNTGLHHFAVPAWDSSELFAHQDQWALGCWA